MSYSDALIEKYAAAVPRYTSYPTAPHFSPAVQSKSVLKWMSEISPEDRISLYIHIPFCDRLCWFCGCHTKHTLKYEPVKRYLQSVYKEIELAANAIGRKQQVAHLHLGGGSPSLLRAEDLAELKRVLMANFGFTYSTEISLEFDPTDLTRDSLKAFAGFGVTRASLGVQDFDSKVQAAINRPQSYEQTKFVVDELRDLGVTSLNIDALYGLPHQNCSSLEDTLACVAELKPDRIALFGYAHVPWVKPHQKLIPESALPGTIARFTQARFAEKYLATEGFAAIGIDHFASESDSLARDYKSRKVRRNFQGYTTDSCDVLLGFGVSSISQFPQGFSQNVKDTHSYKRGVDDGDLPTERGIALSGQDDMIAQVINELMCYFTLTAKPLQQSYGHKADQILMRAHRIASEDQDGFFVKTDDGFEITDFGRPFARSIAAKFDEYLATNEARYSVAV